jgi:hypothetical protein
MYASSDVVYEDGGVYGPTPADRSPAYNRGPLESMPDRPQPADEYDPGMEDMLPSAGHYRARPIRR